MHIEFLLEEESCAAALEHLLPKCVGDKASFVCHIFQGKQDLLGKLPSRLKGYQAWLPEDYRIVVLVDRDNDNCQKLKAQMEDAAVKAGLTTRLTAKKGGKFQVLNRIAIEEMEAWFFGDIDALVAAYPGVPSTLAKRRGYRDPDGIAGGTWEKLEYVLQQARYYTAGMPKVEVARRVSINMDPDRNRSHCFKVLRDGLRELVSDVS